MTTLTDEFVETIYETSHSCFSDAVILHVKNRLLDYLGVTLAGSVLLHKKTSHYLGNIEGGKVPVIGMNRKADMYSAAFINAINAHAAELDDGERRGSIHPGAPIISALLSAAVQFGLTGSELSRGMITGYEAAIRLARSIQPSHRNRGFHATGTCGGIGAALGVGAALGFSRQQMKNALSASATGSAGLLNVIQGASELKPYNVSHASVSGVIAAITARAGLTGSEDVLAGKWGFLDTMADCYDASVLKGFTDGKFAIESIYVKPYAACRHCHPAIEAALFLREQHRVDPNCIKQINIQTYKLAVNGHDHTRIDGTTSAKMSIPFSVAVALLTGKAGIREFSEECIKDTVVLDLANKVYVVADDELNALVPSKRPAIVSIETDGNNAYTHQVELAKGEPENPLTSDELSEKFAMLAIFAGKTPEYAQNLMDYVMSLETSFSQLLELL